MLIGVALARRSADSLAEHVLRGAETITPDPGFELLFDGTETSLNRWRKVGPAGQGFVLVNGELIAYGARDFAILYYAKEAFDDFTLRLQFRIFDSLRHNSGVFLRFRHPQEPVSAALRARALADGAPIDTNPAWTAVYSGFEVQIDDTARGDVTKDFYGRRPEPDGLWKNRTGAIYKIPAGDFIAHLNRYDDVWQQYKPGPALVPGPWFEYEIRVSGDRYIVTLRNLASGAKERTTLYENTDKERGIATLAGRPAGYIGIQSYPGQAVAFRNIRIKRG